MTAKLPIIAGLLFSAAGLLPVSDALAQKKENIQEKNVWHPNLKVDGKPDDWQAPLKAENRSTHLAYTLANDDKNLYLMVQSDDVGNNTKILLGGISLSVNPEGKKKLDNSFRITYPFAGQQAGDLRGSVSIASDQLHHLSEEQVDSLQMAQGNSALATMKDIRIDGFKDVEDSLLSIYNEYGFKAAAHFDENGLYTYELAVPLKALGLSPADPKEFTYNVMVNGMDSGNRRVRINYAFGNSRSRQNADYVALVSPTDFWGKYTLATDTGNAGG